MDSFIQPASSQAIDYQARCKLFVYMCGSEVTRRSNIDPGDDMRNEGKWFLVGVRERAARF